MASEAFPGPHLYRLHDAPELRTPVMLVGLDGWVDAGDVLARTLDAVCSRPSVLVADFDCDQLVDYRTRRPIVHIEGGINIGLTWPSIELLATHDLDGRDVVVLRGPEPDMAWRSFTRQVVELAQLLKVRLVVPFGAYPAATPHTRPVRLSATGTTPLVVEKVGFLDGALDVPAGIHAAIERERAERGIPSVGLWAPVPHYAAGDVYPPSVLQLLATLETLAERRFDRRDLEDQAAGTMTDLDELRESSEEHATLITQLEQHADRARTAVGDLPSGEELAAELQRYLQNPGR